MTNSIKVIFVMGFLQLLMINVNGIGILQSPFPYKNGVFGIETNSVDNISTHIKQGYYPSGHEPLLSIMEYLGGHFMRQNGHPIHDICYRHFLALQPQSNMSINQGLLSP